MANSSFPRKLIALKSLMISLKQYLNFLYLNNKELKWTSKKKKNKASLPSSELSFDETGEHCKSNASRRAHDRRALTGEAGNASRRKVIVEGTARSLEWASAWRTQDESGPTFSRVIRTNFGDRMAKIFRENSDSLGRR
jgi:hypothetical protein